MGVPLPDDVDKRLRAVELRTAKADARDWLLSLKGKVTPFERGQLETAYLLAHMDDVDRPATHPVTGEQVKRTDLLMLANQHRAPSPLMPQPGSEGKPPADLIGSEPILQEGEKVLPANSPAPTEELKRLETTMEILAATEGGRIILREKFGEQGEAYLRRYDSDPKRQIAQGLF